MKVRMCEDCGAVSVPYFGFATPCRADDIGGPRNIVDGEEDRDVVAKRLYVTWASVPWFDRRNFSEGASQEQRDLLHHGQDLVTQVI